jgi:hypothetical protein
LVLPRLRLPPVVRFAAPLFGSLLRKCERTSNAVIPKHSRFRQTL